MEKKNLTIFRGVGKTDRLDTCINNFRRDFEATVAAAAAAEVEKMEEAVKVM